MGDPVDAFRLKQLRLRLDTEDPSFPGWKRLKLGGKDLSKLPREVFQLAELEILNLSPASWIQDLIHSTRIKAEERQSCLHFKLLEVPPDIGKLVNLKVLMLDTNELEELPEETANLTRLERVTLSNNLLTNLPSSFSKLQQLQSLHLANNNFSTFPQGICSLKNLEFLDLSDNQLQEVPRDISKLFNLHSLILFINNLKALPDTICGMTTLHCLWIGNNNISKLPRKFGQLHHLDWGHTGRHMLSTVVDGNPLNDPPLEVCRQGVKSIAQYFEDHPTGKGQSTKSSNENSGLVSPQDNRGRKSKGRRDQDIPTDNSRKGGETMSGRQNDKSSRRRSNPRN